MNNHIYRHGLMAKKTDDGRREIILHKEPPAPRPEPNYETTFVSLKQPWSGCCGFSHEPYSSNIDYGESPRLKDGDQAGSTHTRDIVWTTVAHLASGAKSCNFCHTIWLGLNQYRDSWEAEWNRFNYRDLLAEGISGYTQDEYYRLADENKFGLHTLVDRPVDEAKIHLCLNFPQKKGYVEARLMIEPRERSTYARNRSLVALEYYTQEGIPSIWSAFGPSLQVSANVLSEVSIKKISGWLENCVNTHTACNFVTKYVQPARLLRIEHTLDATRPAVRLCLVDPNQKYRYVALSHCWAYSKPIRTTPQNIHDRLDDIYWDAIPEVFRDTIILSLELGISYIWIDSLCIIQGAEADWLAESPKMGAIYGNAYAVFAAHGSALRLTKEVKKCVGRGISGKVIDSGDTSVFVRARINHDNFVNPSGDPESWLGRAWCFQERLFGSRILHFGGTREEIVFECGVHLQCECGGVENVSQNSSASTWTHQKAQFMRTTKDGKTLDTIEQVEHVWQNYTSLCECFTAQGLTYPEDTLLALSSLADHVSPNLGRYFAGLWEHNILIGLQWESRDGRFCKRYESYIAPSFSWASRFGAAVWYISEEYLTPNFGKCEFAQVLDVNCETLPGAPYGRVTDGYIRLRGYTTIMRFKDEDGCCDLGRLRILKENPKTMDEIDETERPITDIRRKRIMSCYVCMDAIDDILEVRGKPVTCLDIMRDKDDGGYLSALVLLPAVSKPGVYRRVGFSTMTKNFFEGAKLTDVTII